MERKLRRVGASADGYERCPAGEGTALRMYAERDSHAKALRYDSMYVTA